MQMRAIKVGNWDLLCLYRSCLGALGMSTIFFTPGSSSTRQCCQQLFPRCRRFSFLFHVLLYFFLQKHGGHEADNCSWSGRISRGWVMLKGWEWNSRRLSRFLCCSSRVSLLMVQHSCTLESSKLSSARLEGHLQREDSWSLFYCFALRTNL